MKIIIKTVTVLLVIGLWSCTTESNETIPFSNVKNSEYIYIEQKQTIVIRDESEWLTFWNKNVLATDSIGNKVSPETINFQDQMVIGIFWGNGFSGCTNQANAIQTIKRTNSKTVVTLGKISDLGACRAMQFPLQVVKVSRSDLEVVFEGELP